jgi:hypothetical protein
VARIELSAEIREIEAFIDAGQQGEASSRLEAALPALGRRPEYRYLRCLYDCAFRVRSDRALLADVMELVGEQPDLLEATALLALLYSRSGDDSRADLFARMALESKNPAARARAMRALKVELAPEPAGPAATSRPAQRIAPRTASLPPPPPGPEEGPPPPAAVGVAGGPGAAPAADRSDLDEWFLKARRDLVYRRTPTYGVSSLESTAETLLDWGKAVAEGRSELSSNPLPLCRASLGALDDVVVALRRARHAAGAAKIDPSRVAAIAGFFTAVVLHELGAAVYETAAADGGCKVVLPSGAGARPLLAASAATEGTGATLTQLFDRLAAARDLAGPVSQRSQSYGSMPSLAQPRMSWRPLAASKPAASPAPAPTGGLSAMLDTLAMTRPEAEASTVRRLARPRVPADPPALDLGQSAASLADSSVGQEIANRSGGRLSPTPRNVEALEAHCSAKYGDGGIATHLGVWEPSADEEGLILSWGAFLGETLIATYGGIWESDPRTPSDPRLFRVICQDQVVAWPITRVYMRLKNGAAFDMADLTAEVGRLLGER